MGVGDNGTTNYANSEETGGTDSVTLTIDQMPSHTHVQDSHNHPVGNGGYPAPINFALGGSGSAFMGQSGGNGTWTAPVTATNQNTGGGESHENRSSYITVYFWKRVQ